MKKCKKISVLIMAVFCLCGFAVLPVWAESNAKQVYDQAELLNSDQKRAIAELIGELELSSSWDVMAVTTEDAQGQDARSFGELWFEKYHTAEDGVICLIDMDNREIYINTFGNAIYYLTDERLDAILDDAFEAVSNGSYGECFETMVTGISDAFRRGIPGNQNTYNEDTGEVIRYQKARELTPMELVIAVVAALAAGGITMAVIIGKYRLKWGGYQYSYRENSKVVLSKKQDAFVNQIVTHRKIPKESSGKSSGGRSTIHTGAGGRISGGRGKKF